MNKNTESVAEKLRADFLAWCDDTGRAPSLPYFLNLFLFQPGYQISVLIRLQELLRKVPAVGRPFARILWYFSTVWTGCDIDQYAEIAGGIYVPHAIAIVIGGNTKIGRNVTILQGVTIGLADRKLQTGPRIEDHAFLGAGSKILGAITVGAGAVVGANAVVLIDVPPKWRAYGVPAKLYPPNIESAT